MISDKKLKQDFVKLGHGHAIEESSEEKNYDTLLRITFHSKFKAVMFKVKEETTGSFSKGSTSSSHRENMKHLHAKASKKVGVNVRKKIKK